MTEGKTKKRKSLFGFLKKKTKSKSDKKDDAPRSPPNSKKPVSSVNMESPGGVSALTESTALGHQHQNGKLNEKHLLPGLSDDGTGTIIFEDGSPSQHSARLKMARTPTTPTYKKTTTRRRKNSATKGSWITRSRMFQKMSDTAFEAVDQDGSGCVDEKELYSGLLLIHLKLGSFAGPAACKPVSREQIKKVFAKMDRDGSGTLDKEEFKEVMTILCSNVFTRVMAQWSLTLIVVPLIAQYFLQGIGFLAGFLWDQLTTFDEFHIVESMAWAKIEEGQEWLIDKAPTALLSFVDQTQALLEKVPSSVWNSLPLTLVSCILSCLAVPYTIFKIDEFFHSLAEDKKDR